MSSTRAVCLQQVYQHSRMLREYFIQTAALRSRLDGEKIQQVVMMVEAQVLILLVMALTLFCCYPNERAEVEECGSA